MKQYVVYAGLNALNQAIAMARSLQVQADVPVTVVSCDCEQDKKKKMLANTNIKLIPCECGGHKTLAKMVADVLAN
ncbi:MAG: hypothetical protein AUJ28_02525 [Parcubacteria group bacterium CG1_02_37_51]|uniref:Uncharacterized protein n=1 Tax=Candidatus Komeilibacteria bacterium CG_4_10_14_0_8_um_filter_37_78 TaxID=1974471 RepID=A0A2M7RBX4_9BACT|nr:MAG: hypothetical protein AUJ28_02525 [Parcubacteria group bacterium CG1_02_37_51]PIY94249.1 MAG: hypothetical protein COY67_02850 [Candidatus Komeilibacteria bacterium CG_4_10_14_0_8_um_filter_37_78]